MRRLRGLRLPVRDSSGALDDRLSHGPKLSTVSRCLPSPLGNTQSPLPLGAISGSARLAPLLSMPVEARGSHDVQEKSGSYRMLPRLEVPVPTSFPRRM
jgi:hypothetical protein